MGKIENIERQVEDLSQPELVKFREWFAHFDADAWDHQFEVDAKADKLGRLAQKAVEAHRAGKSTKL